jgi:hypothetical protein
MKTTITTIAIAAFTLIGTVSIGQSLNIKGGFTTSTLKGMLDETSSGSSSTNSSKTKNVGGYNASIGYEFKLSKRLSLETGINYQTRGFALESEYSYNYESYYSLETITENYNSTSSYRLNYLDLPVVLNTAILVGDVRVYVRTGIYVGLATGGKLSEQSEITSSDGGYESYDYSEKIDGDFIGERLGGGFIFGAGAEYKAFYFETNYNIGALSATFLDYELYSQDVSFSLGYKLKFKK